MIFKALFIFFGSRITGDTGPSFDSLSYKLEFLKKGIEMKVDSDFQRSFAESLLKCKFLQRWRAWKRTRRASSNKQRRQSTRWTRTSSSDLMSLRQNSTTRWSPLKRRWKEIFLNCQQFWTRSQVEEFEGSVMELETVLNGWLYFNHLARYYFAKWGKYLKMFPPKYAQGERWCVGRLLSFPIRYDRPIHRGNNKAINYLSPLNRVKSWNKWGNQTFGLRFDEFMSPKLWLTTTTPKVDHAAHNFLFWLKSPGRSEKDTWRCEPWFVQGRRERTQKAGLQTGWGMIFCRAAIIDSIRGSNRFD